MRLFAHIVTLNEGDRFLKDFFLWHSWMFDKIFVYDDRSSDNTVDIAESFGAEVRVRFGTPSFMEHEGRFRQEAWTTMIACLKPTEDDWIVALDADQFLVDIDPQGIDSPRQATLLYACAVNAEKQGCKSVNLPIPEVFELRDDKDVYIRTDGFWTGLKQPVMCKFQNDLSFRNKALACGSLPEYAYEKPSDLSCGLNVLHFGYIREEDRKTKYLRYKDVAGHNPTHIESILTTPQLEKWQGQVPRLSQTLR